MNLEQNLKEELNKLEKELKSTNDECIKIQKQIKSMTENNEYLKSEIESKNFEILKYNKEISNIQKQKKEKENCTKSENTTKREQVEDLNENEKREDIELKNKIMVKEDSILKNLYSIQKAYYQSLQEKLRHNIDYLTSLQKDMRISYIIIKKLDITEDFLKNYGLKEETNMFENLRSLSKLGKLNYNSLKSCGPVMMFKVNYESTFDDILKKCIDIWTNNSNFSLYDDAFNNLDLCGNITINDFFYNFYPTDTTLKQGEVVFYMIEKLVNQKCLLESQERSIDSKSEEIEESDDRGKNIANQELENCVNMIKGGEILKGIGQYKVSKIDEKKLYKKTVQMADNNVVYVLTAILFLILSLVSFSYKKNVDYHSSVIYENKKIFENIEFPESANSMNDYLKMFRLYIERLDNYKSNQLSSFYVVSPVRLRFMMVYAYKCIDEYNQLEVFKSLNSENEIICMYDEHIPGNIYEDKGVYTYKYTKDTNIKRLLSTKLGYYDNTGVLIEIDLNQPNDYNSKIRDIKVIEESGKERNSEKYINQHIKAIEFTFTTYNPSLNLFVTNLMLVENDYFLMPIITIADSVAFSSYINDSSIGNRIKVIDSVRLILLIILFSSIILRIIQKCKIYQKSWSTYTKIVIITLIQPKFVILIMAFSFYIASFSFSLSTLTFEEIQASYNYDFYYYAYNQTLFYRYDILSFILVSIYSLKYFQFISSINLIFNSLKKSAFEFISLLVTVLVLFIGLSILTSYVYGPYIYEYRDFINSMTTNIKIFVLMEDTHITMELLKYFRGFSIIILIIFIFIIRYFLLNLFYPVLIENYRLEYDNNFYSKNYTANTEENIQLSFKQNKNPKTSSNKDSGKSKKAGLSNIIAL